jgi:hydrogenase maturation protein HypF
VKNIKKEIIITGIVQGVGFRPFLFNLAQKYGLKGYILNRGNAGVRLVLAGEDDKLNRFVRDIKLKKPKISYIESISVRELDTDENFKGLVIRKSEKGRGKGLTLPPDIAICDECIKDIRDKNKEKYYLYPFVACAVCGPRYTTVKALPYDRERSTMIEFPFCEVGNPSCLEEYQNFNNRRFHAQTYACAICGPHYQLYDKSKKIIKTNSIKEILEISANRINMGEIAAIKGIGGIHLVCLAEDDNILAILRKRKKDRRYKPFAIMVPNLKMLKGHVNISEKEREILNSFRKPIVLLERKTYSTGMKLSNQIAPGLSSIGVMLPYSGIHHLLFDFIGQKPLIYTSGNISDLPMGIENDMIFDQLKEIADFYLLHNRRIFQRCDDSVLRIHDNKVKLIRRSRGYVPEYLPLPFNVDIAGALATGPEINVTGAVLRGNRIFPTQHIGHLRSFETFNFLKDALMNIKNLLQIEDKEIKFIACDSHPAFYTTLYAKELAEKFGVEYFQIQHHFAHVLGLMAENKITPDERIIGISTDGVGYGEPNHVWGGEIFLSTYEGYQRLGHLEFQPMIGGDRCTKYPGRMFASILLNAIGVEESTKIFEEIELKNDLEHKSSELEGIISQFNKSKGIFPAKNIPLTSATGRIFDSVSYLLGACKIKTYQGEPAIRLEGLAVKGNANNIKLSINYSKENGQFIINTSKLLIDILNLLENPKNRKEDIAAAFQVEIGKAFAKVAIEIAKQKGINKIGLTGGVAYNYAFSNTIKKMIFKKGFKFFEHDLIPPGDAGISIGQLIGGIFKYLNQ